MIDHCHSWLIYSSREYMYELYYYYVDIILNLFPLVNKAQSETHLFERIIDKYDIASQHQWYRRSILNGKMYCTVGFARQASLYESIFIALLLKPISVESEVMDVSLRSSNCLKLRQLFLLCVTLMENFALGIWRQLETNDPIRVTIKPSKF